MRFFLLRKDLAFIARKKLQMHPKSSKKCFHHQRRAIRQRRSHQVRWRLSSPETLPPSKVYYTPTLTLSSHSLSLSPLSFPSCGIPYSLASELLQSSIHIGSEFPRHTSQRIGCREPILVFFSFFFFLA